MLIVGTLAIMLVLMIFSLILGGINIGTLLTIEVDNLSLINGSATTYVVPANDVLFAIDTTSLTSAGIALIIAITIVAGVSGIQILSSGLSDASVRVIVLITGFIGIWTALSILAFNLIVQIEIFGSLIYILLTTLYSIGVIIKISEG